MSDCKNCKHLVMYDYKNKSYSCEKWECKFEPKEQEPTTKNDLEVDCISREQAINAVNMCSNSETILNLQQLPSVTPQEPKTGHWREDIDNNRRWDRVRFYCSECGDWQIYGKTHYCPNCGARMAETEET